MRMHGDKHGWARLIPLALGAALGIAGTWLATNTVSGDRTSEGSMPPKPPTAEQITQRASGPRARADDLSQAFRDASRAVLPAVVVIKAPNEKPCPHCGRIHRGDEWDEEVPSPDVGGTVDTGGFPGSIRIRLHRGFVRIGVDESSRRCIDASSCRATVRRKTVSGQIGKG